MRGNTPDNNRRLTAVLGAIVLPLFFASWLTGKVGGPALLVVHVAVALLLTAPLLAKLTNVTYRMVSYYRGVVTYRRAGRPANRLRLLGATLGGSVVLLLGSGLALLVVPASMYPAVKSLHSVSAWLAMVAVLLHLVAHLPETRSLVANDLRSVRSKGSASRVRLAMVAATLLSGAVLAAGLLQQAGHVHSEYYGSRRPAPVCGPGTGVKAACDAARHR